jgi:hypothetical protein
MISGGDALCSIRMRRFGRGVASIKNSIPLTRPPGTRLTVDSLADVTTQ